MKNLFFLFIMCAANYACSDYDLEIPDEYEGTWKIVEVYDPSFLIELELEDFKPIDSEKTITFLSMSDTVLTNGTFCFPNFFQANGIGDKGIFTREDFRITPVDCVLDHLWGTVEIKDSYLFVGYSNCAEGCVEKYEKN